MNRLPNSDRGSGVNNHARCRQYNPARPTHRLAGSARSLPKKPLVSVIVPCRNEAGFIENCLQSILSQEPPDGGFEVIVADGISTDGTCQILEEMAEQHPQLRVIKNPGRIVSTGLNAGIRAARGDIIIRMDAHTVFAPDYIKQCLAVLEETGADNVGGPVHSVAGTYLERAIRAGYHSPLGVGGARSHNTGYEGYVDTVVYGCWRREAFIRFGLFDEELVRNQDDEHNFRITRGGGKIYQSRRVRSWYRVRSSLPSLFRQYMQYGYWKVLVIKKHGRPASIRHLVPGAFVGIVGLGALLGLLWSPALIGLAGVLCAYGAVVVCGSCLAARRAGWKLLPILPFVFTCLHFGYGYGFLRGLCDFVLFNNAPSKEFVRLTRHQDSKCHEPVA
jgi:succinoglycan biosynthesis protein ExoA